MERGAPETAALLVGRIGLGLALPSTSPAGGAGQRAPRGPMERPRQRPGSAAVRLARGVEYPDGRVIRGTDRAASYPEHPASTRNHATAAPSTARREQYSVIACKLDEHASNRQAQVQYLWRLNSGHGTYVSHWLGVVGTKSLIWQKFSVNVDAIVN
jgi:hypothetical protein